jgi:Polyketide cyclase / dehydrase and lipid transport
MPDARHEVTIRRPTGEVSAFIADGLNGPKWRPGVLDIAHVSGTGVGATYTQGVKGPGGRRVDADYRVTEYEPGRRLAFEAIAGPVRPTGTYLLEETPDGSRLTFSLHAELGGIKKLLMGGAVQKTMDAEVAATERLKGLLESAAPP